MNFCPHCNYEYKEEELNAKRRCPECGGSIPEEKKLSKNSSKYSQMSIYSISNGKKTITENTDTQQEELISNKESAQFIEKSSFPENEETTIEPIKTKQMSSDEEMDSDLLEFLSQYEIETIEDNDLYQLDEPCSTEEKKPFKKNIAVTSKSLESFVSTEKIAEKTPPNLNSEDIQKKSNWIHEQIKNNKERKKEKLEPNIEYDFNKDGFYDDSLSKEPAQADLIPHKTILKVIFWALGLVLFTIFIIMYM